MIPPQPMQVMAEDPMLCFEGRNGFPALVGPRLGPRFFRGFRNWLKEMVGTWGLEPQTSTVSR
jgi:hypothetical protein